MRFEAITFHHVQRAVDLYLKAAYDGGDVPKGLPLPTASALDTPVTEILDSFLDESVQEPGGARCYALRLGNRQYAFMKLRLLEFLVRDEFLFSVDTHDQMFDARNDPKLAQLMVWNRELKLEIEAAWEGAGLPTAVNVKGLVESGPISPAPRKNVRVLLVEDDPAIRDTISHVLDIAGYDVDLAWDGQDAVKKADAAKHAVILMDVEMPRMDGLEACGLLKGDADRSQIPILLMTAGAVGLARDASPDGFLVKPFQVDSLLRFLDVQLKDAVQGTPSSSR